MQFGTENYVNKNCVLSSIIISMDSRKNAKNTLKQIFMSNEYISYWGQHLKTFNTTKKYLQKPRIFSRLFKTSKINYIAYSTIKYTRYAKTAKKLAVFANFCFIGNITTVYKHLT